MSYLRAFGHTNCCGVNIIMPCAPGPRLLSPDQKEQIAESFRNRLAQQRASALVRYFFVPDWFTEEFAALVARRANKEDFRLVARRKKGDVYILCKQPKGME